MVDQPSTGSYHGEVAEASVAQITVPNDALREAARLLKRLFQHIDRKIVLRLWNGKRLTLGNAHPPGNIAPPNFELVCRSPGVIRKLVLGRDPLRLADAYFRGEIDVAGDFFSALELKDHLHSLHLSLRDWLLALKTMLRLDRTSSAADLRRGNRPALYGCPVKAHSRAENRDAIAFHYDVSNDFYALWLDPAMVYSCAYFERPDVSLEQAQKAKLDHICRKLVLRRGESLLDIGCGWGALIIHAAREYGVRAHGVTLSRQQAELASERIRKAGLEDQVSVELRDYRDIPGEGVYDKIASVGMFEHIGLKNLPVYFSTVHRLLKSDGLFLNHGITHYVEGWKKSLSTEFINRYVFPDGQLDTIANIQRTMERGGFEIADVEGLRRHYAMTLRRWVAQLEAHHEQALEFVSEATYRVWRLYMAACALEFESGEIGIYQVLAGKYGAPSTQLPLTRRHLYA
jgi:cyclopropane-fatty-acyl-phospholipid synthase